MALRLLVPFDAFGWIVGTPAPTDTEIEHTAKQGDGPIGLVGGVHTHATMQSLDITVRHAGDFVTPKRRFDIAPNSRLVVASCGGSEAREIVIRKPVA